MTLNVFLSLKLYRILSGPQTKKLLHCCSLHIKQVNRIDRRIRLPFLSFLSFKFVHVQ